MLKVSPLATPSKMTEPPPLIVSISSFAELRPGKRDRFAVCLENREHVAALVVENFIVAFAPLIGSLAVPPVKVSLALPTFSFSVEPFAPAEILLALSLPQT